MKKVVPVSASVFGAIVFGYPCLPIVLFLTLALTGTLYQTPAVFVVFLGCYLVLTIAGACFATATICKPPLGRQHFATAGIIGATVGLSLVTWYWLCEWEHLSLP
jgi:hypothetical protein